jgi:benzoyl-CoA reductase/2-hydroxyglutaryl-CoA dehydratase subunit BcrC/BadD/HgdB
MKSPPARIPFEQWDQRYADLIAQGLHEPPYGGPLRRHLQAGDDRLPQLCFDNSPAALRLWNFLLSEEDRLRQARRAGQFIVGTMKDLGTVPVMVYAMNRAVAFYPDGAWWTPCMMHASPCDLALAAAAGLDESFCPVRAMAGAFLSGRQFPRPDLLVCSAGATCDDFSAIAARLETMGFPIFWWEICARRHGEPGEEAVALPGGGAAPRGQVQFVAAELERVRAQLESAAGQTLDDAALARGIRAANQIRRRLAEICRLAFGSAMCPLPALEMLIAQMLAIHFCSDRAQTLEVLNDLLMEIHRRIAAGQGVLPPDAVRIYWVNPVADLRAMNLLEDCGGRLCGNDLMFAHATDEIPEDVPPLEALARCALADPMVGPADDRAARICREARALQTQAVIVSRIAGASHCAFEGAVICRRVSEDLGLPVLEIEVPSVSDALAPSLRTRIEALIETARRGAQRSRT